MQSVGLLTENSHAGRATSTESTARHESVSVRLSATGETLGLIEGGTLDVIALVRQTDDGQGHGGKGHHEEEGEEGAHGGGFGFCE